MSQCSTSDPANPMCFPKPIYFETFHLTLQHSSFILNFFFQHSSFTFKLSSVHQQNIQQSSIFFFDKNSLRWLRIVMTVFSAPTAIGTRHSSSNSSSNRTRRGTNRCSIRTNTSSNPNSNSRWCTILSALLSATNKQRGSTLISNSRTILRCLKV